MTGKWVAGKYVSSFGAYRVADRLVRESLERQVVIFTHDIVFYKLLLEAAERLSQEKIGYISLERSRDYAGLVRTFERGIHIQRLTRLDDISQIDFDTINSAYNKCCNNFSSHDTATGMG